MDNAGDMYAHDIVVDSMFTVNKATGAGTLLGPTGFDANFAQGGNCDPNDGTCYLFAFNNTTFQGEERSVNLATGATTYIGDLATNLGGLGEVEADIPGGGGGFTLTTSGTCPGVVNIATSGGSW